MPKHERLDTKWTVKRILFNLGIKISSTFVFKSGKGGGVKSQFFKHLPN